MTVNFVTIFVDLFDCLVQILLMAWNVLRRGKEREGVSTCVCARAREKEERESEGGGKERRKRGSRE